MVIWDSKHKHHILTRSARLNLLEDRMAAIVKARKYFPVPLSVNQFQRKQYLLDALNGRPSKLSKQDTTA